MEVGGLGKNNADSRQRVWSNYRRQENLGLKGWPYRVSFNGIFLYFILNCLTFAFCYMFVHLIHLSAEKEPDRTHKIS